MPHCEGGGKAEQARVVLASQTHGKAHSALLVQVTQPPIGFLQR